MSRLPVSTVLLARFDPRFSSAGVRCTDGNWWLDGIVSCRGTILGPTSQRWCWPR